jgi:hypothetical protein
MIRFYEEDLKRRKVDHLKEKQEKIQRCNATINNLQYLLKLEEER